MVSKEILGRISGATQAFTKTSTKHILYPMLWLCGIFLAAGTPVAILGPIYLGASLLGVSACFGAATLWMFVYFAKNDPDRLHSEDYLLGQKMVEYELLGDSSSGTEYADTPKMKKEALREQKVITDE